MQKNHKIVSNQGQPGTTRDHQRHHRPPQTTRDLLPGNCRGLVSTPDDDECSLLSRLGSDSPRPRVKYGGMFCSVEGAFENKTLNFESFSPASQRRVPPTRTPRWDPDYCSDTASACGPPNLSSSAPRREPASGCDARTSLVKKQG
ncbi:unnamed protein product [Gadus morhua 'NCC']